VTVEVTEEQPVWNAALVVALKLSGRTTEAIHRILVRMVATVVESVTKRIVADTLIAFRTHYQPDVATRVTCPILPCK
jgi:hypothetical protein